MFEIKLEKSLNPIKLNTILYTLAIEHIEVRKYTVMKSKLRLHFENRELVDKNKVKQIVENILSK